MATQPYDPAHKVIIHRYLDWEKVRARLARFPNLSHHFDETRLRRCADRSPYYCHYLAWRLGTWGTEGLFRFFDELFAYGSSLKNWKSNQNLLFSCGFDEFWGLLWQLQMARYLGSHGDTSVAWTRSGPDLKIAGNGEFFVECYTYRKSYGLEEFIGEICRCMHQRLKVDHASYTRFALPRNSSRDAFLDSLFRPFLDPLFLQERLEAADVEYPQMLPVPEGTENFHFYVEGENAENYVPMRVLNVGGTPEAYLSNAIKEALDNKRNSNRLREFHPNLLAVNFLLGGDFQTALSRQVDLRLPIPYPDFGTSFDGVLVTTCGIDELPSLSRSILWVRPGITHPVLDLLGLGG